METQHTGSTLLKDIKYDGKPSKNEALIQKVMMEMETPQQNNNQGGIDQPIQSTAPVNVQLPRDMEILPNPSPPPVPPRSQINNPIPSMLAFNQSKIKNKFSNIMGSKTNVRAILLILLICLIFQVSASREMIVSLLSKITCKPMQLGCIIALVNTLLIVFILERTTE